MIGAEVAVKGKPTYFLIFIFQNNSSDKTDKQTAKAISAEVAVRREV